MKIIKGGVFIKILKLTNEELRALKEVLTNHNVCSSGCVYEEMTKSKKDCDECEFTESIWSIIEKIDDI